MDPGNVTHRIFVLIYPPLPRPPFTCRYLSRPYLTADSVLSLILCGYACSHPPRRDEPPEGSLDVDPNFAMAPASFATRGTRTSGQGGGTGANGAAAGGSHGGALGGTSNVGHTTFDGFARSSVGSANATAGIGAGASSGGAGGVGVASAAGESRWRAGGRRRPLQFSPAIMSPLPVTMPHGVGHYQQNQQQRNQQQDQNHPPPRPLTPAPHAGGTGASSSASSTAGADALALR